MKQFKNLTLLAVLLSAPAVSMAQGVITFNGKVVSQTCSMKVEGVTNPTVGLPGVAASQLNAASKYAGVTPFKVSVSGCSPSGAKVKMRLAGAQVSSGGNLKNTATAGQAQNVELQLMDGVNGAAIILPQSGYAELPEITIPQGQTTSERTFAVRYYSTAAATAGNVRSVVNYDLSYQ